METESDTVTDEIVESDGYSDDGCSDDDMDVYGMSTNDHDSEASADHVTVDNPFELHMEAPLTAHVVNPYEQPIYPNARITLATSIILIMTFAITHRISTVALTDLLSLINLHCLVDVGVLQSLYRFQSFFDYKNSPLKYHYYCPKCSLSLKKSVSQCSNSLCDQKFGSTCEPSYFLEIPVEQQLRAMFQREGFYTDLQYRFTRNDQSTKIEDLYDGDIYKKHVQNDGHGFLNSPHNISFLLNTDGVSVFKSSNVSLWPIYMQINELPFNKRKLKQNTILCGLWFGTDKPNNYDEFF